MDGPDLAALVEAGGLLYATKVFMVSLHGLWIYEYFLTLGDEIKYAWSMKKSWIFVLFLANRYTPVLHLIWIHTVMFSYTKPFCQATKWMPMFHASATTIPAQMAVALRVYAVTEKNRSFGGALSVLIAAQFVFGIYSVVRMARGPLSVLPDINLDPFKVCIYQRWRLGELLYVNQLIAFDVTAFLMILTRFKRSRANRYLGIPNILSRILGDATAYFMLIFASQLSFQLFLFFAPSDIQLLPGVACTILTPIMASRLILSLKKAVVEPRGPWSTVMTDFGTRGVPRGDGAIQFPVVRSREIRETLVPMDGEVIELGYTPQFSPNPGSQRPWQSRRSLLPPPSP